VRLRAKIYVPRFAVANFVATINQDQIILLLVLIKPSTLINITFLEATYFKNYRKGEQKIL